MAPVELRMDVHCYKCAKKIRKSLQNLRGVRRVSASPEQGLVVVYGTTDPYALRRLLERKMDRPVKIVSDGGSAPYYYQDDTTSARQYYGPSQPPAYGWGVAAPPHDYYPQPPPPHDYYSQPPPAEWSYPYAARGYGAGWADPDPYRYRQQSSGSFCSIM